MFAKKIARILCATALIGAAKPALADVAFNFDGFALQHTIINDTLGQAGSLQATFQDTVSPITCDPIPGECGYQVRDPLETESNGNGGTQYRFDFTFTSHLVALGFGHDPLQITFSSPVSSFSTPFALRFPDSLNAEFLLNGTEIALVNYSAAIPPGHEFDEGLISYSGAAFNQVILQTPVTNFYPNGVGNPPTLNGSVSLTIGEVTVPEPASLLLLGGALAGLSLRRRRT